MRETLVLCGGLTRPKRIHGNLVELDKGPNAVPQNRVDLKLESLSSLLVDNLDPILRDAVEIAAYVLMADRLIKRGTDRMEHMGAAWRRRLRFRLPVRQREVWNSPAVIEALVGTLGFLSEDHIDFEFEQGDPDALLDPYLGFQDKAAQRLQPDDIILFSGGLDSLAGAVEQLIGKGRSAVLVTHKSSTTVANRQDELARQLQERASQRLLYAPVWVRKGSFEPVEYTQRTRSFLFVSLGIAVARMFERDTVHFFENGITSFNLPIAEHVIGTRASRTTHPKVMASFSNLFSLLTQRTISIENRYIWHTKRDVVDVINASGCADLIAKTTSCARIRNLSMTAKQCGVCSQCVERQYAIRAAGLQKCEPHDAYAVDLFVGAHETPADITMAEQHLVRAHRLSSISEHSFLASYGQVFRALPCLEGTAAENALKVFKLHQRYGREIVEVAEAELRMNSGLDQVLDMPPTSLLAMIGAPAGAEVPVGDPTEREAPASAQAAANPIPIRNRRFAFAIDEAEETILFSDGPVLSGVSFALFSRLAVQFRRDVDSGAKVDEFKFINTATLMTDLSVEEHTLRQRVARIRASLKSQFIAAIDYVIDEDDFIQNIPWQGYRLSPYLLIESPSQVRNRLAVTTSSAHVTPSASGS